ncbi:MAG: hypothetical protein K940chlam6_01077 [Chlamydiae bacterium]|nr:hypothetical protein [Chlamydiota bacterium]
MSYMGKIETPLKETAAWAALMGPLSMGFSLGREYLSSRYPQLDSSAFFLRFLPQAQPLGKSFIWGSLFGAYNYHLIKHSGDLNPKRCAQIFFMSAGLSSLTLHFLQEDGATYSDYMEIGKPFVYTLGGLTVSMIALQYFRSCFNTTNR